jgi:hypothetical protein
MNSANVVDIGNIVSVSQNGVGVKDAFGVEQLFSVKNPFAKLDKTKPSSFRNIRLLFNHEPPNPDGLIAFGPLTTLVYQFAHGYDYVPSTWFLMQNLAQTGVGLQPAYQQEGGTVIETDAGFFTAAILRVNADKDNVYFYVDKYYQQGDGQPLPNILGFTLLIRVYVFAGDLTGTVAGS